MSASIITADPVQLGEAAGEMESVADQLTNASGSFSTDTISTFGLLLSYLESPYDQAISDTQRFLTDVSSAVQHIADALKGCAEDYEHTETTNQTQLEQILSKLEEIETLLKSQGSGGSGSTGGAGSSGGSYGGGAGGGSYGGSSGGSSGGSYGGGSYGGGSGSATGGSSEISSGTSSGDSSDGSSSDDSQEELYDTAQVAQEAAAGINLKSADELAQEATAASGNGSGDAPDDGDGLPGAGDDGDGADGAQSVLLDDSSTDGDGMSGNVETDGNAPDDGGADDGIDGLQQELGAASAGSASRDGVVYVDGDGDGNIDAAFRLQDGDTAAVSLQDDDNGTLIGVDLDNDGQGDVAMRVSDAEARYEAIREQAQQEVWEQLAASDPLGRSADELQALYADAEPLEFPEEDSINGVSYTATSERSLG